ncbi:MULTISPECIES: hypothetical protein [Corynebacterium]|uniref:hypothetical protein n=1 Tax=Corynebacterium TaxID=1716 RepID=UPI0011463036|nr:MULTISPECIES: hypothetical protein [Corynebacterium]MBF9011855.1 hypothetical protein [Corynebacterium phoceense]
MFTFETFPEIVAVGGSTPSRLQGREAVADSKVSIRLANKKSLEKCLHQLEVSDARLVERGPKVPDPYDWQFVIKEVFQDGDAVVYSGVAWYDIDYFNEKECISRPATFHYVQFYGGRPSRCIGRALDKISLNAAL